MLTLQNDMNSKVNPNWAHANNDWMLAAMIETVEAIDHHGWKWWKKQEPDIKQLQMELVDVWHFALSAYIVGYKDRTLLLADEIEKIISIESKSLMYTDNTLLQNLRLHVKFMANDEFNLGLFLTTLKQSGMTQEDLYKKYIGKNVLNFFRQDNGYKEGTYQKMWGEREDNEHLESLLFVLNLDVDNPQKVIYDALLERYVALIYI
jgi:dimeric dUTPase (all-alpha-NTP-PPase superfamily)